MDIQTFWKIIGEEDINNVEKLVTVTERLRPMNINEQLDFRAIQHHLFKKLCTKENEKIYKELTFTKNNSSFMGFLYWIISKGEGIYNQFLEEPKSFDIKEWDGMDWDFYEFAAIVPYLVDEKTFYQEYEEHYVRVAEKLAAAV